MTTLQIGKMTQTSDINIQTAVETALASASARKKEAEKQSAIAAALKEAGLAEWAEPETEVWSKPVTLIAIDTSNIWQTSKGGEN